MSSLLKSILNPLTRTTSLRHCLFSSNSRQISYRSLASSPPLWLVSADTIEFDRWESVSRLFANCIPPFHLFCWRHLLVSLHNDFTGFELIPLSFFGNLLFQSIFKVPLIDSQCLIELRTLTFIFWAYLIQFLLSLYLLYLCLFLLLFCGRFVFWITPLKIHFTSCFKLRPRLCFV